MQQALSIPCIDSSLAFRTPGQAIRVLATKESIMAPYR